MTLSGQLLLIDLLERLVGAGTGVLSVNTDGLFFRVRRTGDAWRSPDWQTDSGMTLEVFDFAPCLFRRGLAGPLSSRMCSDEAAMASIKVFDPVSVPFSVLEELQQLRTKSSNSARRTNAFLARRTNAFARRTNASNANSKGPAPGLDQAAKSQSKRPAAPFSKGPPKPQPKTPAANPARPTGTTATACPPAPRLSMKSWGLD